jgi:hypothetical protein
MSELVAATRAVAFGSSTFVQAALAVSSSSSSSSDLAARLAALCAAPPCATLQDLARVDGGPRQLVPDVFLLRRLDPRAGIFEAWTTLGEPCHAAVTVHPVEALGGSARARARLAMIVEQIPRGLAFAEVYGVGVAEHLGLAFVVHEPIQGESLAERVMRTPLGDRRRVVLETLDEIAPSLDAAHAAGLPGITLTAADVVFQFGRTARGGSYGSLMVAPTRALLRDQTAARALTPSTLAPPSPAAQIARLAIDAYTTPFGLHHSASPADWQQALGDPTGSAAHMLARLRDHP